MRRHAIAEEGSFRGRSTALLARLTVSRNRQPGLQVATNQPQRPLVPNPAGQPRHRHDVVHRVEELFWVEVDHDAADPGDMRAGGPDRIIGASARAEAVESLQEARIGQRRQQLMHRLLDHTVEHRRSAEHPELCGKLGDDG